MKNLSIWIITILTTIVFLVGIFYYEILGAVVNPFAFVFSLIIIFLILILVIIFSQKDPKNRMTHFEKPKILKFEKEEEKLKVSKEKIKKK